MAEPRMHLKEDATIPPSETATVVDPESTSHTPTPAAEQEKTVNSATADDSNDGPISKQITTSSSEADVANKTEQDNNNITSSEGNIGIVGNDLEQGKKPVPVQDESKLLHGRKFFFLLRRCRRAVHFPPPGLASIVDWVILETPHEGVSHLKKNGYKL